MNANVLPGGLTIEQFETIAQLRSGRNKMSWEAVTVWWNAAHEDDRISQDALETRYARARDARETRLERDEDVIDESSVDLAPDEKPPASAEAPLETVIARLDRLEQFTTNVDRLTSAVNRIDRALTPMRTGSFIFLTDIHHPRNIPLDGICRFIADFKPDFLVDGGDSFDNEPFSHWLADRRRAHRTMPYPKDMYAAHNAEMLLPLRHAAGDSCELIYLLGNHEDWVLQYLELHPEGAGYFEVANNVDGIPDLVICFRKNPLNPYLIGDPDSGVRFLHAPTTSARQPRKMHTQQVSEAHPRGNILYGHIHDHQAMTRTTAAYLPKTRVMSVPCLSTLAPSYGNGADNRFSNGFAYGHVDEGSAHIVVVPIENGAFYADGVRYSVV